MVSYSVPSLALSYECRNYMNLLSPFLNIVYNSGVLAHDEKSVATRGPSQYKDSLSRYGDFHYKYRTVSRPSFLYNGNPHTWKNCLYIQLRQGPGANQINWWALHRSQNSTKNGTMYGLIAAILTPNSGSPQIRARSRSWPHFHQAERGSTPG